MSNEYTALEWELLHESDVHIQNEASLLKLVNEIQPFLKELLKFTLQPELFDWGETVLGDITKTKRLVSFRKTIHKRRYPNS